MSMWDVGVHTQTLTVTAEITNSSHQTTQLLERTHSHIDNYTLKWKTIREFWLNFTFQESALPLTESSRPRTTALSKSTSPRLTRTDVPSQVTTLPTLSAATFAPVVRLMTLSTDLLRKTVCSRTFSPTPVKSHLQNKNRRKVTFLNGASSFSL